MGRDGVYPFYMKTASIPVSKNELMRFRSAASRYGVSPDALIRRIVAEATHAILAVPEETPEEYENAQEIMRAMRSAVRAGKKGTLLRVLPATLRVSR